MGEVSVLFGMKKKPKPTAEQLALRDDVHEARALQEAVTGEIDMLKRSVPLINRLTSPIIDRQGQNHYIETLFHHYPKGKAT